MPTVPVPLFNEVYRNVNGVELRDKTEYLMNGYIDEQGATHGRPGLETFIDLGLGSGARIDGLFWWKQTGCVLAVADGKLFKVTYPSQIATKTNLYGSDRLNQNAKVSFAQDGSYAFMANGGSILKTDGTNVAEALSDAEAPTTADDVVYLDTYLLANESGTGRFRYSEVGDTLSWRSIARASAMGYPDDISALKIYNREIYLFGAESVEFWENDGASPFARVPGGALQVGCIAPKSIVVTSDGVYWLNHNREFVVFNGQSVEQLSTPYDKELESFSAVSDCRGEYLKIDGHGFFFWSFPSEQRTLVYNLTDKTWSEWGVFNSETAKYSHWLAADYCYAPAWGLHLVGDRSNSVIYKMASSLYDDDGDAIRLVRRSGHIDYGTSQRKRSRRMRFRAKRGHAGTTRTPQLMVRWKDDNKSWSNERWYSLGDQGDTDLVVEIGPTGIYKTRQYEFVCTDPVPVIFLYAEEDIDVLR